MSAQDLIFNNVELLGYTHQNNFFGEKSLCYSATKTISLRGFVLDLVNTNGVNGIFTDVNSLLKQTKEFQNIVINNQNFGTGKIKSFSVDAGNWVKTTRYSIDIEVLVEVPIENITSKEFNGVDLNNKKLNLLKSFSETFSLDFDTNNSVLGGEHSIEIEYDTDNSNINVIELAQSLATELLKTLPAHPNIAEGNYTTRSNYKVLNSENYNLVNGKCGFKRSFSYSTINSGQPYSFVRTHSLSIDQNGVASISENCTIKAESDNPSLYANALIGYNQQVLDVFLRSNIVFQNYKNKFGIIRNLNTHQVEKSVQVNKFDGTISFTIVFDNDPKKQNPLYQWEYTSVLDRNENGVWNVSENGSVLGFGKTGSEEKYKNIDDNWPTIRSNILARVTSFYNSESKNGYGFLKELSKTINRKKYEGSLEYNFIYTDDPSVKDGSDMGIKKINIEKTNDGLPVLIKNFLIPNLTYALVQNRNFTQQGTYTVKVNMEIGCVNNFNSFNYFNKAKSYAGGAPGLGIDEYLESVNYSCDEIEKTISYEATYKYS